MNEISIPELNKVQKGVDLTQFVNPKTGKTAFEEYNEKIAKFIIKKELKD